MESRSVRKVTDDEVLDVARGVAERLMTSAGDAEGHVGLGEGAPGVALALRYAAEVFGEQSYLKAGHLQLRRTAETSATAPLHEVGLFSGTAGVVWVVSEYARLEPRYLPALTTMTDQLARQTLALELPLAAGSVASHHYDAIAGTAGQLAGLLKAADVLGGPPTAAAREAAERLVDHLLDLGEEEGGRLRWFCAPSQYPGIPGPDGQPTPHPGFLKHWPNGMYNLGFAHGMPGMLAALCRADMAHAAGIMGWSGRGGARPRRVRRRIRELARMLDDWRIHGLGHAAWDTALPPHPETGLPDSTVPQEPARTGWCYGAPGVAAALLSASAACEDPEPAELAVAALTGVERTPLEQQRLYAPTLCHGLAGLLPVYGRAAEQTGVPDLRRLHDEFRSRVCAYADPDHSFLFQDQPAPGRLVHRAGLLNGAAGVLLALLGTVSRAAAAWDELLFLTPQADARDEAGVTTT
ncbi:lanthionine synthetase C family protein [Streptomyces oryzae]|uniref:Lanthionine synthetase C family protein n=1 Tax=Streptomyces oryzae TaxID=1434886 RepID=A0ABS3XJX6_9ACTN|nr:lanthionine synthetase C family protein [Streptomyces oryzae]MBO8195707.1 lanthionine synthetase C family protein [Streptomyces oryzae]